MRGFTCAAKVEGTQVGLEQPWWSSKQKKLVQMSPLTVDLCLEVFPGQVFLTISESRWGSARAKPLPLCIYQLIAAEQWLHFPKAVAWLLDTYVSVCQIEESFQS